MNETEYNNFAIKLTKKIGRLDLPQMKKLRNYVDSEINKREKEKRD